MKRTQIYGIGACVAVLTAAGCNSSGGSNSTFAVPAKSAIRESLARQTGGTVTEYAIPRGRPGPPKIFPVGIAPGPDGTMWFAERGLGKLGSITTDGQFVSENKLKGQARRPQNVVTGPDGNLWATAGSTRTYRQESHGVPDPYGAIEAMTPAGQVVSVTALPMFSDPRTIVSGPDGNLWFTTSGGFIGRITTTGNLQKFKVPHHNKSTGMAVGPDGNIWFCETYSEELGRITPEGKITMFSFPRTGGCSSIVTGPDGNLWTCEFVKHRVAQVSASDGSILKEVELKRHSFPKGIAVGGDGNLYAAEFGTGKIAEISTDGVLVAEIATSTRNSGPWIVATDRDGNIWFTESLIGKIGKLTLAPKR